MRVLLTLAIVLLLAGCDNTPKAAPKSAPKWVVADWERDPATQSYIDPRRILALQKKGTKACLCERKRGRETQAECWSEFWKEANEYRSSGEWVTACGPGSYAGIDFTNKASAGRDVKMVVHTAWGYGACSEDEVEIRKREYERKTERRGC